MPIKRVTLILFLTLVFLVNLFFWTNPHSHKTGTVKIYDLHGTLLYESSENLGKKTFIPFTQFPDSLIKAVISVEDATFWTNSGFDLSAIGKAFFKNVTGGKIVTGASTITQQLVRITIFDNSYSQNRNYIRKIREVLTAARLNMFMSKKSILEAYLNEVYFGNESYGIESASQTYFNKPATSLSLAESALLAGVISSPYQNNPFDNYKNSKKRQEIVLDLMVKNKYITQEDADLAKLEPLQLAYSNQNTKLIEAPHFVHYVLQELQKTDAYPYISTGLKIYTTLDISKYRMALDEVRNNIKKTSQEHNLTNAAVVLLNNDSGAIEVMIGGANYFDGSVQGQVNMATSPRQPGSSIKPLTYLLALQNGMTPATLINDTQKVFLTKKGEGFTPRNYDNIFHGNVTLREALASSLNMPAVELLSTLGVNNFIDLAQKMGISTFSRTTDYDLAITLGGGEVTLLEETNMYATIARYGRYLPVYSIDKITDDENKILYMHKNPDSTKVLEEKGEQVAYLITNILSDSKARMMGFGEKNPLVLSRPAAVKTGTTTDWHDVWTVGYIPQYTLGVWAGNNNNEAMTHISGVTGAAPIWHNIFESLLKEIPPRNFEIPTGIVTAWVCKDTGLIKLEGCKNKIEEYFIDGTLPNQSDSQKPDFSISILSPENKAKYLQSLYMIRDPKIEFKISPNTSLKKIEWELNGKIIATSLKTPYFNYFWTPEIGSFNLKIIGYTKFGEVLESNSVEFEVTE